jgi:cell division transport system permease protein
MPILALFRAIKFSVQDVFRNFWLSLVTITIMVLSLFIVNLLITVRVITNSAIDSIKDKIDITLYMKNNSTETDIGSLKTRVEALPLVKQVDYVSQAQALDQFRQKNQANPDVLQALRELNNNPLTPTLIVKPRDVTQYDDLVVSLDQLNSTIIDSKNADNPKLMLDKINRVASKINEVGMIVSLIFIAITILVVYNTIRINIFTHNREIKVMRLVGASNWFIRAPFIFSGIIYSLFGLAITLALFFPFLTLLHPYLKTFFAGYNLDIIQYFQLNYLRIFGFQLLAACLINIIASVIAVRKYSKI